MGLRHCRIRLNQRRKLIEYFVMAVTARLAADVIGVHPNTTALFYHKLREVIAEKIAEDVPFDGEIKGDESNFGAGSVGRLARCQCLACSSGGERFIPKSLRMPLRP